MRLDDFILEESILSELRATSKREALAEMVEVLVECGCLEAGEAGSVVGSLMQREEIGSTGIGHGVAIPHAKHPAVRRLLGACARSDRGVEFNAPDGQPVRAIFLILWPDGVIGPHLEAIAQVSRVLKRDAFLEHLKNATDKRAIVDLFSEADREAQS